MTGLVDIEHSNLDHDGAVLELGEGRALRVRIEPDPDYSINDYDSDGKVAVVTRDRDRCCDAPRPAGFNGRARKLWTYDGYRFWWQPYEELTDAQIVADVERIRELMTFGFHGVILELCDGVDHYGRPIVRDAASLWGIDSTDPAYVRDVVADLVTELSL